MLQTPYCSINIYDGTSISRSEFFSDPAKTLIYKLKSAYRGSIKDGYREDNTLAYNSGDGYNLDMCSVDKEMNMLDTCTFQITDYSLDGVGLFREFLHDGNFVEVQMGWVLSDKGYTEVQEKFKSLEHTVKTTDKYKSLISNLFELGSVITTVFWGFIPPHGIKHKFNDDGTITYEVNCKDLLALFMTRQINSEKYTDFYLSEVVKYIASRNNLCFTDNSVALNTTRDWKCSQRYPITKSYGTDYAFIVKLAKDFGCVSWVEWFLSRVIAKAYDLNKSTAFSPLPEGAGNYLSLRYNENKTGLIVTGLNDATSDEGETFNKTRDAFLKSNNIVYASLAKASSTSEEEVLKVFNQLTSENKVVKTNEVVTGTGTKVEYTSVYEIPVQIVTNDMVEGKGVFHFKPIDVLYNAETNPPLYYFVWKPLIPDNTPNIRDYGMGKEGQSVQFSDYFSKDLKLTLPIIQVTNISCETIEDEEKVFENTLNYSGKQTLVLNNDVNLTEDGDTGGLSTSIETKEKDAPIEELPVMDVERFNADERLLSCNKDTFEQVVGKLRGNKYLKDVTVDTLGDEKKKAKERQDLLKNPSNPNPYLTTMERVVPNQESEEYNATFYQARTNDGSIKDFYVRYKNGATEFYILDAENHKLLKRISESKPGEYPASMIAAANNMIDYLDRIVAREEDPNDFMDRQLTWGLWRRVEPVKEEGIPESKALAMAEGAASSKGKFKYTETDYGEPFPFYRLNDKWQLELLHGNAFVNVGDNCVVSVHLGGTQKDVTGRNKLVSRCISKVSHNFTNTDFSTQVTVIS